MSSRVSEHKQPPQRKRKGARGVAVKINNSSSACFELGLEQGGGLAWASWANSASEQDKKTVLVIASNSRIEEYLGKPSRQVERARRNTTATRKTQGDDQERARRDPSWEVKMDGRKEGKGQVQRRDGVVGFQAICSENRIIWGKYLEDKVRQRVKVDKCIGIATRSQLSKLVDIGNRGAERMRTTSEASHAPKSWRTSDTPTFPQLALAEWVSSPMSDSSAGTRLTVDDCLSAKTDSQNISVVAIDFGLWTSFG
ncbi:hypothetical protein C8J56DRAFT_905141 [Mycena floridula]|nr:hypothetical protein C8J56DRAFT_905141 [Mycena floridula]